MTKAIIVLFILVIFLSPVFFFIKFLKGKKSKQKKSSWEGKLVDKKHLEYEDDDSSYTKDLYTLYFETIEGGKIKMNIAKKVYDAWEIGNKAIKAEGELLPKKIA